MFNLIDKYVALAAPTGENNYVTKYQCLVYKCRQPGRYTLHGKLKFFFRWILHQGRIHNAYQANNKSILELTEKSKMTAKMAAFHRKIVTF